MDEFMFGDDFTDENTMAVEPKKEEAPVKKKNVIFDFMKAHKWEIIGCAAAAYISYKFGINKGYRSGFGDGKTSGEVLANADWYKYLEDALPEEDLMYEVARHVDVNGVTSLSVKNICPATIEQMKELIKYLNFNK